MKKLELSRRSFLTAAVLGAAFVPSLALADEKKADDAKQPAQEKAAQQEAAKPTESDIEGTWLLVTAEADNEEDFAALQLVVMLSGMTLTLSKDGKAVSSTVNLLEDAEAEPTQSEGTWALTDDGKVRIDIDGETSDLGYKNLSLYIEYNEEGLKGSLVFARPQDVLSGDWAVAQAPEVFDTQREGIEGLWTMVAMSDTSAEEAQNAIYSATALVSGMGMIFDFVQDGTVTLTMLNDAESEPEVVKGTWEKTDEGYALSGEDMGYALSLEDGRLTIEAEGTKVVFAPVVNG